MSAWWYGTRCEFVDITSDEIAEKLNSVATDDGWKVEIEQKSKHIFIEQHQKHSLKDIVVN